MGAVCSTWVVQPNAELGMPKKLKTQKKSFWKKKDMNEDIGKNLKWVSSELQSSFSTEPNSSIGTLTASKTMIRNKTSFLGRAGERAVEVLDMLGSSVSNLNTNSGFVSGVTSRGNRKISILSFEVANTITKGANLFSSLSEESIQFLKNEILQSEGVQILVSTDMKELLSFAAAEKREEYDVFSREVSRFGDLCKDPQWHNLNRYFYSLNRDVSSQNHPRNEAEKTMKELIVLAENTGELYNELNAFERFEQDYRQKVQEMESLNIPLKGESLTMFQSELKHQKNLVKSLKKKSLWSRSFEEIVEKLVTVVTYMHQAIHESLRNNDVSLVSNEPSKGPSRLGAAGLALHYANVISQINTIASRPTCLPSNTRETLFHSLPNHVKRTLPSRLQNTDTNRKLPISEVKAGLDKTLQWLLPLATNTTKLNQGFGWVGEWASACSDSGNKTSSERSLCRLQTLYYAEMDKTDHYILELLICLHHIICHVRSRNQDSKSLPL